MDVNMDIMGINMILWMLVWYYGYEYDIMDMNMILLLWIWYYGY